MKRFLKTLFVTLLIGAIVCFGFACDNGSNGNNTPKTPGLQIRTFNGEKRIIGYVPEANEKDVDLVIPNDVVEIQSGAFDGNSTIKTIEVGANVKKIAVGAFNGMKSLESIKLPYVGGSVNAVNEKKTFGYIFGADSFDEGDAITQNYNASSSATYYLPKTLKTVAYSIKSDIYSEQQKEFIAKYIKNVFYIVYQACEKNTYYALDENYNVIDSTYDNAKDTVSAVMDLDSVVASYILEEIVHDYDCGAGSFYMCVDFSDESLYKKLTFLCPWDYDWTCN